MNLDLFKVPHYKFRVALRQNWHTLACLREFVEASLELEACGYAYDLVLLGHP
jgi:hypothetical protein